MSIETLAEQFVDDLSFETMLAWCDIYKVFHDEEMWVDDDWIDKEDELRDNLVDAIVGERK
jgi:hypothetical protein